MAIGGFLGGLANLGAIAGGAQQYQLQDAHIRQALAQLAAEQRRQQMLDFALQQQQKEQQASQIGFQALLQGGNLFGQPQQPGAGQPDYSQGAVQAQPLPLTPPQSSMRTANGAPSVGQLNQALLRIESGNRDYPPDSSAGAVGPGQIMPSTAAGYGVGGAALRDPNVNRQLSRRITGDLYSQFGGNPDLVAIGYNAGPGRAQKIAAGAPLSSLPAETQQYVAKLHRELDLAPEEQQQAQSVAVDAATAIPPQMAGRLTPQMLARAINNVAGPGVPDDVKMGALTSLYKLMAPQAQQAFQQQWEMFKFAQSESDKAAVRAETHSRDVATEEYRRARLAQAGAGGEKLAAGKNYEITNKETGESRVVFGRERKGEAGLIDAMTGQPIPFDPAKETIKEVTASTAGGGRAGAQIQRQLTGGAEVKADLQNVANMPVGTTTGYLGGLVGERTGISLSNAAKTDLANQLTSTDEINMKIALAGLGRELSTLMSPVYGGNWASEQLEPMIPKAGYSIENALYGIARIKQSAVNALESLQASPILGSEQKKYAAKLIKEVDAAIPWTVQDVVAFRQQQNPQETFGEFAGRSGVSGAAAGGGQAPEMTEEQYNAAPSGTRYRVPGKPDVYVKP